MTQVFVSTLGQNDNLGDSVLRRGLVDAVRAGERNRLHVFVGDNDDAYLSALGLRDSDLLYRERAGWYRAAAAAMVRDRTWLVETAGEVICGGGPLGAMRTLGGIWAARVRGGGGIQIGAGLRDPQADIPPLERLARRNLAIAAWRDPQTKAALKTGEIAPDWAFGEGTPPDELDSADEPRSLVAFTVRGDREAPGAETLRVVQEIAERTQSSVQVVSQVKRDNELAIRLSQQLGSPHDPLLWRDETHAEWEEEVRRLYRRSLVVASDRAHALIIGATEGAIPVGVSGVSTAKVRRIMQPAGFDLPDESGVVDYVEGLRAEERAVTDRLRAAKAVIVGLRERIAARFAA